MCIAAGRIEHDKVTIRTLGQCNGDRAFDASEWLLVWNSEDDVARSRDGSSVSLVRESLQRSRLQTGVIVLVQVHAQMGLGFPYTTTRVRYRYLLGT